MPSALFLSQIAEELKSVSRDGLLPPTTPVQEDEKPVGKLDPALVPLYYLMQRYEKRYSAIRTEGAHLGIDLHNDPKNADLLKRAEKVVQRLAVARQQHDAVRQLFWASIRTQLPDLPIGGLGIRQDFQLVVLPEESRSTMMIAIPVEDRQAEAGPVQ